jgi:hypothetical protein
MEEDIFSTSQRAMVVSNLDTHEWRTELERVGPRLKTGGGGGGGWQERIEAMNIHSSALSKSAMGGDMTNVMRNLKSDIERLERGHGLVNRSLVVEKLRGEYEEASASVRARERSANSWAAAARQRPASLTRTRRANDLLL